MKIMTVFKRIIVVVTFIYLSACGYMYFAQDSLIFKPKHDIKPVTEVFPGANEYWISTPEGNAIQIWYKPARSGKETLIYLHGNAGNLSTRGRLINILSEDDRGLLIFSWGGFGMSEGKPSEQSFYSDARAVFDWLESKKGLKASDLIVYGESLGTGVAVQLAMERDFKGAVLAAPYTSIAQMAANDYPWLPVDLLLNHRFDSIDKITEITEPMVIMHSTDDDTIPFEQGEMLFKAATEPKLFMPFTDRQHTKFRSEEIGKAVRWILVRN